MGGFCIGYPNGLGYSEAMTTKYWNFTVTTDCGQYDVVACDHHSARADVEQAYTGCTVVQVSYKDEA